MPEEVVHEVISDSPVAQIEAAIDEATAEVTEVIQAAEAVEEEHWNKLAKMVAAEVKDEVASEVYDKMKKLVTDLLDATEDAAEIALETAAPVTTEEATEETSGEEEDVKPKRSHPLFRKPGKKED